MMDLHGICPACGIDANVWTSQRTFSERMTNALRHPSDDVQMTAIIILGNRAEPSTAVPLAQEALKLPMNVCRGLAIVQSIAKVSAPPEKEHALTLMAAHPARVIWQAVGMLASDSATSAVEGVGDC